MHSKESMVEWMGQLVGRKERGEVSLHFNLKKKIEKKKLRAASMQKPSSSYQVDTGEVGQGAHTWRTGGRRSLMMQPQHEECSQYCSANWKSTERLNFGIAMCCWGCWFAWDVVILSLCTCTAKQHFRSLKYISWKTILNSKIRFFVMRRERKYVSWCMFEMTECWHGRWGVGGGGCSHFLKVLCPGK